MDLFELIKKRESCRSYADRPVEAEKLRACLEAARLAPSACNSQPWSYVVVSNPELVPKVAKCTQNGGFLPIPVTNRFTGGAKAFIVVIEEKATLSARLGGMLASQTFAPMDIGLSVMQLCLAAAAQGLGTCILGIFNEKELKELLHIEKGRIRLVISVGYPAESEARPKNRRPLEEVARFIE